MYNEEDYYYYSISEGFTCTNSSPNNPNSKKGNNKMNNNNYNKKRFSDEQVKSLESIFENETKLEPKKKVQIAKELGLQPRQIAIWFQNKRARYKSKELERDFNILRDSYNVLLSKYDLLQKEKQSLTIELEKMKELVGKSGEDQCGNDSGVTNNEESILEIHSPKYNDNNKTKSNQIEGNHALSMEVSDNGASILSSDEGSSDNNDYFGMDENTDLLTMVHPIDGNSIPSSHEWGDDLPPHTVFDLPVDNCQWLDFWS